MTSKSQSIDAAPTYLLRFPGGNKQHEFVLVEHYDALKADIEQRNAELQRIYATNNVNTSLLRESQEREQRLRTALKEIADFKGYSSVAHHLALIAETALSPETGAPHGE